MAPNISQHTFASPPERLFFCAIKNFTNIPSLAKTLLCLDFDRFEKSGWMKCHEMPQNSTWGSVRRQRNSKGSFRWNKNMKTLPVEVVLSARQTSMMPQHQDVTSKNTCPPPFSSFVCVGWIGCWRDWSSTDFHCLRTFASSFPEKCSQSDVSVERINAAPEKWLLVRRHHLGLGFPAKFQQIPTDSDSLAAESVQRLGGPCHKPFPVRWDALSVEGFVASWLRPQGAATRWPRWLRSRRFCCVAWVVQGRNPSNKNGTCMSHMSHMCWKLRVLWRHLTSEFQEIIVACPLRLWGGRRHFQLSRHRLSGIPGMHFHFVEFEVEEAP